MTASTQCHTVSPVIRSSQTFDTFKTRHSVCLDIMQLIIKLLAEQRPEH